MKTKTLLKRAAKLHPILRLSLLSTHETEQKRKSKKGAAV